PIAKLKITTV
ncbi:clp protease family protein, partial [Chlamydia psittaci 84-8471/1]